MYDQDRGLSRSLPVPADTSPLPPSACPGLCRGFLNQVMLSILQDYHLTNFHDAHFSRVE